MILLYDKLFSDQGKDHGSYEQGSWKSRRCIILFRPMLLALVMRNRPAERNPDIGILREPLLTRHQQDRYFRNAARSLIFTSSQCAHVAIR